MLFSSKAYVRALLVVLQLAAASVAFAQSPGVSPGVPSESFLGEQFCFDSTFSNTDGPGYGPYYRLVLPPQLAFDSATIFGSPMAVVFNQVFPGTGLLNDPLTSAPANASVSGTPGFRLLVLRLPIGSVTSGGPPLTSTLCLTIQTNALVGTPLPVAITPVYQFGDTPTGINGSIIGAAPAQAVSPTVLEFTKSNSAPEAERPPGARWPIVYTLTANIANSAVINPLVLSDTLPPDLQFVGPVSIVGGSGCSTTQSPSVLTPGGVLEVTCTGATVGTPSPTDVVVSFPAHVVDTLDETSCAVEVQSNSASAQATYLPSVGAPNVLAALLDTSEVDAEHVVVQKGVSPDGGAPGAALTYTLSLQTSEFATTALLDVLDTLPSGIDFVAHANLTINGVPIAITPVVVAGVNDTVSYDIRAALGTDIPPGSAISLSYTAVVLQRYKDTLQPVLAADPLTNTVRATYALTAGASGCTNDSAATFLVAPLEIRKSLLSTGPFLPGDFLTFRLAMDIPSGDTQNIRFRDFLPLPVFNVSGITLSYGGPDVFRAVGGADADTLGLTPALSIDSANNALILDYPNVSTTSPQTLAVDVRVQVTNTPFADNLFLTNIFRASADNTGGEELVSNAPIQLTVRAPSLDLIKGVLTTSRGAGNPPISPLPSVLPVDGNATGMDAGDTVTFRITVENQGGAPAYNVIVTDPGVAGLSACSVVGLTRADSTVLTSSGVLATGLTLINGAPGNSVLAANDGSLGAPFGADTAFVDVQCTIDANVEPNQLLTNTGSASWMSQPPGTPGVVAFPSVSDSASVRIALPLQTKTRVASSEASTTDPRLAVGEIVRYRLATQIPEGQIPDFRVFDVLPPGLTFLADGSARVVFVANGSGLASSTLGAVPTISGNAAAAALTPLSTGLDLSAAGAAQIGTGTLNCAAGSFGSGTDVCFRLGDLSNTDSDADAEFVVIEFNALVDNTAAGSNDLGDVRNNLYRVGSGTNQLGANSGNVSATIAEPSITNLLKSVSPASADAGDTVTYTVTFSNANGANNSTAFDVLLQDTLPAGLSLNLGSVAVALGGGASGTTNSSAGNSVDLTIDTVPPGGSVSVSYSALVLNTVAPGTTLNNTANVFYSSLPGSAGTAVNPTGSTTPGASGSDTGERNGNGSGPNDYIGSNSAALPITAVGLSKQLFSSSLGYTGASQDRPAIGDLTIGEIAVFRITATIPEGTTPQVVIADQAPFAGGVFEILSGSVVSTSPNLVFSPGLPPTITLSDAQLSDGINDLISFDFGQVQNPPNAGDDLIVIEVVTRVRNLPANTSGDRLTNTASVQFGAGLSGTATAAIDLVEPQLEVDKSGSISTGQAGDSVDYTVVVRHTSASTMDAQALEVVDTLPAELINLSAVTTNTSGTCVPAPVIVDSSIAGEVSIALDQLPLGCELEITYSATLANTVGVGTTVSNTATVTYASVDPAAPDGPFGRSYSANDSHPIAISQPGLSKVVTATSEPDTGSAQFGAGEPDLTIGEQVTYRFTATLPAGVSANATAIDQLPTATVSMRVVSSRIVSVGASISGAPAVGTAGVASDGVDADSFEDRVVWNMGTLTTAPGGGVGSDQIEFEVVAQVMDTAQSNGGADDQVNTASFSTSTSPTATGTALVDIVEPRLQLAKAITSPAAPAIVQAGDVISYQITLSHQSGAGGSSADAYNLVVSDLLPDPGVVFVGGSTGGTCAGVSTDLSAAPLLRFNLPSLSLASATCTITYQATVANNVNPGVTYANSAQATYDSQPVFVAGATRRSTTAPDSDSFVVLAPSLVKVTTSSDVNETGAGAGSPLLLDLAIGETVTYTLTVGFPQGTSLNSVLVDTLPASAAGVLEVIGAGAVSFGNAGISTSLPGAPVFSDAQLGDGRNDTTTFDFGTISNPANGNLTDDFLQVTLVARVVDLPQNQAGIVLTNSARFTTATTTPVTSQASIEVVEPVLTLAKTLGPISGGSVQVGLQLSNSGTAPAYDIEIIDVLDASTWDLASIATVSVPPGFVLDSVPGPGPTQTTVRLRSDPGATLPAGAVLPAGSVTATFSVELATLPPNPNPVSNTATNTGASSYPGLGNPDDREYPDLDDTATLGVPAQTLSKTFVLLDDNDSSGDVSPGDVVRFDLLLSNTGAGDLTGIEIGETVPAHATFAAAGSSPVWSCIDGAAAGSTCDLIVGTLPAGDSVTLNFAMRIVNPLPAGIVGTVNQATIRSNELPPDVSDDPGQPGPSDPTPVPIAAAPDLLISKTDGGISTLPGASLIYTLSYANVGNQDATGVLITETVPANTRFAAATSSPGWSCADAAAAGSVCTLTVGNLAAGAPVQTLVFGLTVDSPLAAGVTEIANTALIADDGSNGVDPNPGNNSGSDTTPIAAAPDLVLLKTDGDVSTTAGGSVVYALSYSNVGSQDATGVVITETVPANTRFAAAASSAGWSCVDASPAGTTCTLTVGNVAAGAPAASVNFALIVDIPLPAGVTEIANTAAIADDGANGPDPTPGNNSDGDTTPVAAAPDLVLSKSDGGITGSAGAVVVYTLTYANVGTQDATGVVITETVPAGVVFEVASSSAGWSCADGAPAGTVCTLSVGAVAAAAPPASRSFAVRLPDPIPVGLKGIVNTAVIADDGSNGPDPTPGDNSATDSTPVGATPDLEITKTDGDVSTVAGGNVIYTLAYRNVGSQNAAGVVITETVPAHSRFSSATSTPGWSCADAAPAGSPCTFAIGALVVGASGSVAFGVDVLSTLPTGVTEIANGASIADDGAGGPDPTPGNNSANDVTPVAAAPDLQLTKTDADVIAVPGEALVYALSYRNVGTQDAIGVVLTETVPVYTRFRQASSSPGWTCADAAPAGSVCTLAVGAVAAGAPAMGANFAVTVDSPLPAGVEGLLNVASVADDGSNGPDPTPADNSDDEPTPVDAAPDMSVVKSSAVRSIGNGMVVVYELLYSNIGNQTATGVVLTETVPVNSVFVAGSSSAGWSCADAAVAGTACLLPVGTVLAGESATVEFAVRIDIGIAGGRVSNTVQVDDDGSNGPDPTPDNNVSTLDLTAPPLRPEFIPSLGDAGRLLLLLSVMLIGALALRRR